MVYLWKATIYGATEMKLMKDENTGAFSCTRFSKISCNNIK